MLADADIVIGMTATSGEQFCIYGRDRLEDGGIPEGFRTVVIRLDPENEDTHELENICVLVDDIKGRHDYSPLFFPFQLIPIDSTEFTGVFGGRRWE